jgi:hypothetical protein
MWNVRTFSPFVNQLLVDSTTDANGEIIVGWGSTSYYSNYDMLKLFKAYGADGKAGAKYFSVWDAGIIKLLNGSNQAVVTVELENINPPTTQITSPANGALLSGTVSITANATDDGLVNKVEFYRDNGVLLGSDLTAPYSTDLVTTTLVPGAHSLYTKAYDEFGNIGVSSVISVNIKDQVAPTTSIFNPAAGSVFPRRATINITATASDNVGISRVEFYVNGVLKCTDTTAQYDCSYTMPNGKGNISLQSKAYDAAGNVGVSGVVIISTK